jgi:hypothetical protein
LIAELNDKNEAGSDSEDYNMKGDAKPYTEVSESARYVSKRSQLYMLQKLKL